MPRYMHFNETDKVKKMADDPSCFGIDWDPMDSVCTEECSAYYRCGKALNQNKQSTKVVRTTSSSSSTSLSKGLSTARSEGTAVIRPKTPKDFPPGTEYLPPERAGESTAIERGFAIAKAEGMSAGFGQFFSSLARFSQDITAWHPNAGRWKYGDNYGKKRPKKKEE